MTSSFDEKTLTDSLCEFLATQVKDFSPEQHLDTSFSYLGLDSMGHVQLSGVVEKCLNKEIEPTLAFNYPTVNSMVNHLKNNGLLT